jgi:hypothetical protein
MECQDFWEVTVVFGYTYSSVSKDLSAVIFKVKKPENNHPFTLLDLEEKVLRSYKMSRTSNPTIQHNVPEDLKVQLSELRVQ